MVEPGEPSRPGAAPEDLFFDLLVETLTSLEEHVRALFLQRFFRVITQLELTEAQSLECWEQSLRRRRELSESLGKEVSLKTAMVEVLTSARFLRLPILMEYEEFKKLQVNAATDALTGLYNRRLFEEYCEKELNRAKRYAQHLAIAILDLHRLKEVNDQFGHMKGDGVLQLAAATLRKALRSADFAFRIGGDEFALLLPQTEPEQARTLGRRLRAAFESEIAKMNLPIPVTLDFGIAVHPQDGDEKERLLRLADERLYELKHAGRGRAPVVPLEPAPPRERPEGAAKPSGVPPPPEPTVPSPPIPSPAPFLQQRKWERVSLTGTRSYAVLNDAKKSAAVIDLSYGGVALLVSKPEEVPNQFYAVLYVPILPPVRVSLRKIYARPLEGGRARVGCSFVS